MFKAVLNVRKKPLHALTMKNAKYQPD